MSDREFQAVLAPAILKVGPEVYLASQLSEISSRFAAHVEELRAFLLKEKLPVPSPDAVPELAKRLESDARFRADVGSLLRATLYQERERVGPEELLGMLITAAAGTKHDLNSEAQSAQIREMLRFVLQSRRATFRVEPEEESEAAEAEGREPVAVGATAAKAEAVRVDVEPVLVGRLHSRLDREEEGVRPRIGAAAEAKAPSEFVKDRPILTRESAADIPILTRESAKNRPILTKEPETGRPILTRESASADQRESRGRGDREASDLVLPPFRTAELFAAHRDPEPAWWRAHPAWIAGVICMVLGVGLGLVMHRVVSAAEMHTVARPVASTSSRPSAAAPVPTHGSAASSNVIAGRNRSVVTAHAVDRQPHAGGDGTGITEAPVRTAETGTVDAGQAAKGQAPHGAGLLEGRATPPAVETPVEGAAKGSAVPVTVVKQVVTASPSGPDAANSAGGTQMMSATKSVVHPGSVGMTAANVIFSPAPEYPPAAAAARVHGQVTVHAVVDPDGNVIYARAVSGPALLRDAAQEAVHKWRYKPLLDNGKPIAVTTVAILDFKVAK